MVALFLDKNRVVNAFVEAENTGGGVLPLNFTTATCCTPEEAVVGTYNEVIVKFAGAVNQYPLTLPGNVLLCAGIARFCTGPAGTRLST